MTISFSGLWEVGVLIVSISLAVLFWRMASLIKDIGSDLKDLIKNLNDTTKKLNVLIDDIQDIADTISSLISSLSVVGQSLHRLATKLDEKLKLMLESKLKEEKVLEQKPDTEKGR